MAENYGRSPYSGMVDAALLAAAVLLIAYLLYGTGLGGLAPFLTTTLEHAAAPEAAGPRSGGARR